MWGPTLPLRLRKAPARAPVPPPTRDSEAVAVDEALAVQVLEQRGGAAHLGLEAAGGAGAVGPGRPTEEWSQRA